MKVCTSCGDTLPFESFYPLPASPDGYAWRCKTCTKVRQKLRYLQNREDILERKRLQYAAAHPKKRQFIRIPTLEES